MKLYLGVAMTAVLLLASCAQPKPAAPAVATTADGPAADGTQTASAAPAKKKRCSDQTGSRLAPCGDGSTGDSVGSTSNQDAKDAMMNSARYGAPK